MSDSTRHLAPLAVALLTLLACVSPPERPNAADHVFRNARVYTLDSRLPWAQAVAVRGTDITYVGNSTGLEAYVGPETEVHDVGGRLLLPGFIDSHMHPVGTAALINGLQLEPTGSIQDWLEQVEEFAADHPEHKVIFGIGHRQTTFGPDGPHRSMLDAVVPERPVALLSRVMKNAYPEAFFITLLRMEHLVGSIEVGKRADLVVLTDDIMQVPPERIHKADVVLTMVDGRLVYESNFLTRWLLRLFF